MKSKNEIVNFILVVLGIFSAGFGFKGFLLPSHFIDGGVIGVSMLLAEATHIPLSVLIFLANVPFIYLAYRRLGVSFAIRSALAIAGLSLCLAFITFPEMTHDKSLTAVFGGFFIGMGIGLAIRSEAVLDGTEIAALLVSKKMQLFKVSDVILVFNVLIFSMAVFVLGVESALYSILTYISASKTVDFILNGIEQYTSITVVSTKGDAIRQMISDMGRGVTVYEGKKGYGKDGHINDIRDIIFTVVTRLEIPVIKSRILQIDPSAFIVQQSIEDTTGGLLKRKNVH
ncbi:MAG: YitT family protein [Bacteroidetes bacterium]|nr:YitT family protein [Bacteroidota bacterium]